MDAKELIENYAREAAQKSGLHEPERSEAQAELVSHLFEAASATGAATLESAKAAIFDCDPDAFFGPYRSEQAPASWGARIGAGALDFLIAGVIVILLTAPFSFMVVAGATSDAMDLGEEWECSGGIMPWGASYTSTSESKEGEALCKQMLVSQLLIQIAGIILFVMYFVILEATWGRTVGKAAAGLRVQGTDGEKIGFGKALGRHWTKIIFMIFVIELIVALFTKKRFSDELSKTRVVRN